MTPHRRASDHPAWNWLTAVGVLLALAAFAMRWVGRVEGSDFWAALVFAALLIRPDKLVDVVRARFSGAPPAGGADEPAA